MPENLKSSKKVVGIKQSAKALENGTAALVFVARDADPRVIKGIIELCTKNSVEIVYEESMKQLGKACGIEVGAAVACIVK
ncbi:MAG: ribosomal L7Ae/L30e/S12e/Gadd45 family protein [Clostridia bacterium]|nr:ribosomal L7Ae/L30e/S12e/Gadd45 family protein [Clostridia bacterium]